MDRIKKQLLSTTSMSLSEATSLVKDEGNEMLRALLQGYLQRCTDAEVPVTVVGADDVKRDQVRSATRRIETPLGDVSVERRLYQAQGVEGIAPLDAALGLPAEHYGHDVRRIVADEVSRSSYDEVAETLAKHTSAHVPKRQIEELAIRGACDFDAFYRDRLHTPEPTAADHLLVLSFDGKGIAMLHEHLREPTRRKAAAASRKLQTRLTKGEKPNSKRMAQVATVYSVAPYERTISDVLHGLTKRDTTSRPRPTNKRVWASIEHNMQRVIDDAFAEALRRDPDHKRRWVVLLDGNADQIARVKRAAQTVGATITIVLDIIHVLEYLWRAAYAFHADGTIAAERWVENQLLKLLTGGSGGAIAKSMRAMIISHKLDETEAAPVEAAATYLVNHTRELHYDRALADGLPIATGVIEGACRYLVQDRMGRTGARWSLAGAEAVLRLRALRASGDFDDYWMFHVAKEYERTHQSRYADGDVPNPLPATRGRANLRLV
jgi:hypothetical protein